MTSDMFPVESSHCTEDEVKQNAEGTDPENDYDVLPLCKRWCSSSLFARGINAFYFLLLLAKIVADQTRFRLIFVFLILPWRYKTSVPKKFWYPRPPCPTSIPDLTIIPTTML